MNRSSEQELKKAVIESINELDNLNHLQYIYTLLKILREG